MKRALILCFMIFISACAKPSDTEGLSVGLDTGKLAEISKSFCGVGESLVELNLDPVPLQFEFLNTPGTLIAFVNGNISCALSKDLNENWGTDWFGIQLHSTCLPNNSYWKITDGYNANDTRYYKLDSADPAGLPTIDLWGSRTLNTVYARDHIGLRVMKCLPTNL
jgi:hypothetical protein